MNTLEEKLQKDLIEAMKKKNEVAMSAIRSVKTAIQTEKTNGKYHELEDTDILKIIQKLVKQRLEAQQIYLAASQPRLDLAGKEREERLVLERYLPKMLTEDETKEAVHMVVKETGATSMKDMGKVMSMLNSRYSGRIDGGIASKLVKAILTASV